MNTKTIGFGLIGFGLVMLLLNYYQVQADLTLLIIGSCFLFAYFGKFIGDRKNVGFLIPGSLLVAIGIWEIVSSISFFSQYEDVGFFIALATGFLAIYLVGTVNKHKVFWSAIVATCLYGFGIFVYLVSYSQLFVDHEDLIFPMILIFVGVFMIVATGITKLRKR